MGTEEIRRLIEGSKLKQPSLLNSIKEQTMAINNVFHRSNLMYFWPQRLKREKMLAEIIITVITAIKPLYRGKGWGLNSIPG